MNENLKAFATRLQEDKGLNEKVLTLADLPGEEKTAAILDLAAQIGCPLTAEDLPAVKKQELSDEELDAVAGGAYCVCMVGGGGDADSAYNNYNSFTCVCVGGGGGEGCSYMTTWENRGCRCACVLTGLGEDQPASLT